MVTLSPLLPLGITFVNANYEETDPKTENVYSAGFISLSVGADAPFTVVDAACMFAAVLALDWAASLLKPGK